MSLVPGSDVTVPDNAGWKLTYDDLVELPEDRLRHELIDGEHYVTPAPSIRHQTIVLTIGSTLRAHARAHNLGRVFVAPLDVLFSKMDVVEPDVLFVSRARAADVLRKKYLVGAPDLVVEVGSKWTRRRDETLKQKLYERFAVPEYWIVDPDLDVIKLFRLVDERYRRVAELSLEAGDVLTTPLLPGLELPLAEIFED
jgi:Uma2 family endonuclease